MPGPGQSHAKTSAPSNGVSSASTATENKFKKWLANTFLKLPSDKVYVPPISKKDSWQQNTRNVATEASSPVSFVETLNPFDEYEQSPTSPKTSELSRRYPSGQTLFSQSCATNRTRDAPGALDRNPSDHEFQAQSLGRNNGPKRAPPAHLSKGLSESSRCENKSTVFSEKDNRRCIRSKSVRQRRPTDSLVDREDFLRGFLGGEAVSKETMEETLNGWQPRPISQRVEIASAKVCSIDLEDVLS